MLDWEQEIASAIAAVLNEFRSREGRVMRALAIDCHPWNGTIYLAWLTQEEFLESPELLEPAEMAAWKLYGFESRLNAGQALVKVAKTMRKEYELSEDRQAKATDFFVACARAMTSAAVKEALQRYSTGKDFRIFVPHPDTNEEF